jgi:hypothetical protein
MMGEKNDGDEARDMKGIAENSGWNTGVPPKLARRRGGPGLFALGAVAVMAGVLIVFAFDPSRHGFYPACSFHAFTGLHCPGCGSLRALHHLFNGELSVAFRLNPLLILSLPMFAWIGARAVLRKSSLSVQSKWLWTFLAVLLAFGVLRNLPVAALAWMAP